MDLVFVHGWGFHGGLWNDMRERISGLEHGLVDLGFKKHYRVSHGQNEFARGRSHINGIESFWAYAKRRLMKFHGIAESTFYLHLKECEFRFNYRDENIYLLLLKMFRTRPLF